MQKLQAVDIESGLTWIADKGKYKGRLACYPEMMLELLETNQRYLRELASALKRPVSELPRSSLSRTSKKRRLAQKLSCVNLASGFPLPTLGDTSSIPILMEHHGSDEVRDCLLWALFAW